MEFGKTLSRSNTCAHRVPHSGKRWSFRQHWNGRHMPEEGRVPHPHCGARTLGAEDGSPQETQQQGQSGTAARQPTRPLRHHRNFLKHLFCGRRRDRTLVAPFQLHRCWHHPKLKSFISYCCWQRRGPSCGSKPCHRREPAPGSFSLPQEGSWWPATIETR